MIFMHQNPQAVGQSEFLEMYHKLCKIINNEGIIQVIQEET